VHLQFLPSQHPADAPRVVYFSGDQCSTHRDASACNVHRNGSAALPQQTVACETPDSPVAVQNPHLPASSRASLGKIPLSTAAVQVGVVCSIEVACEGAGAIITEAHTPKLACACNEPRTATLLTIAGSTQSPRSHCPLPELCKHAAAETAAQGQEASPCSPDGTAALAPPILPLSAWIHQSEQQKCAARWILHTPHSLQQHRIQRRFMLLASRFIIALG
jgi:hypothetical protein